MATTPDPPCLTVAAAGARFDALHGALALGVAPLADETPPDTLLGIATAEPFRPAAARPTFATALVATSAGPRLDTFMTMSLTQAPAAHDLARLCALVNMITSWPARLDPLIGRPDPGLDVHLVIGRDWGLLIPDDAEWALARDHAYTLSRSAVGWIAGTPESSHDRRVAGRRAARVARLFAAVTADVRWARHGGLTADLVEIDDL